jgi:hypothetical protein
MVNANQRHRYSVVHIYTYYYRHEWHRKLNGHRRASIIGMKRTHEAQDLSIMAAAMGHVETMHMVTHLAPQALRHVSKVI